MYIHNFMQPPPLSSSWAFSLLQKKTWYPLRSHSPSFLLPAPGNRQFAFSFSTAYSFWVFPINGIIKYVAFYVWLLSLSVMFLSSSHAVAYVRTSWLSNYLMCKYYILFTHLSIDGHLGCFHPLTIVNMLLWILVYKYLFEYRFQFFGCIPRSEIAMINLYLTFWATVKPFKCD